jgi:hypothetical protein
VPFIIAIYFSPKNIINVTTPNQVHSHNDTALLRQLVEDVLKEKEANQKPKEAKPVQQTKPATP